MWEQAFYLQYKNVKAFWNIANRVDVATRFDSVRGLARGETALAPAIASSLRVDVVAGPANLSKPYLSESYPERRKLDFSRLWAPTKSVRVPEGLVSRMKPSIFFGSACQSEMGD